MLVEANMGTEEKVKLAYLTRKRKQLRVTIILLVIAAVFFVIGICAGVGAIVLKNQDYKELVGITSATAYADRIESYTTAIEIDPDNPTAYRCLLAAYEDNGKFDKSESGAFLSLYNRAEFDSDTTDTAELRYKAGRMFMVIYTEDGETPGFATRIQKAAPFFEDNAKSDASYSEKPFNDCFHMICDFYKTYVFESSTVKETDVTAVNRLMDSVQAAVAAAKDADAYDRLFVYSNVLNLIYDRRLTLAQSDYSLESVLALIDEIHEEAGAMAVEKEVTKQLQKEISDKNEAVRQAVELSYNGRKQK